ncbi:hypothetical protein D9M68_806700 [compost metagenome]
MEHGERDSGRDRQRSGWFDQRSVHGSFRLAQLPQQTFAPLVELVSRIGQGQTPGIALDQAYLQSAFQCCQVPACSSI